MYAEDRSVILRGIQRGHCRSMSMSRYGLFSTTGLDLIGTPSHHPERLGYLNFQLLKACSCPETPHCFRITRNPFIDPINRSPATHWNLLEKKGLSCLSSRSIVVKSCKTALTGHGPI